MCTTPSRGGAREELANTETGDQEVTKRRYVSGLGGETGGEEPMEWVMKARARKRGSR